MLRLHRLALSLAVSFSLSSVPSYAQAVQTSARPVTRILQKVDTSITASLAGTRAPIVATSQLGARLDPSTQLGNMRLVLTPTEDQETALRTLMSEQQDKSSPNYHKWLTPETFGQYFGASTADVETITAWLQSQGFKVEGVSHSLRVISFSGTCSQVEAAFHTQMNHITVDGEQHFTNTTELQVPQAFASIVKGVDQLNDFHPKAKAVNFHTDTIAKDSSGVTPMYTSTSSGSHYITPGDSAIIFNSQPLLTSGIDGTGTSVGVIARSNVLMADVQQFRSMFGLKKNDPTFTVLGSDPGINGDDLEAYLDVEWAGAMAPGAKVNFVVAGSDYYNSSGINASGLYLVDNNLTDIITLSYGGCETGNGASGTAFWNTLWQQAAAQGQSVFVSTGDSNATGCQASNATYGTAYGVNALGSSAYNVAVGGSMFVDSAPGISSYWASGVSAPAPSNYNFATALGYIPEAAWNEGYLTTTLLSSGAATSFASGAGIVGTGGGISLCTARPAWQTGSGIPAASDAIGVSSGTGMAAALSGCSNTLHRLVPDLSLIAASGHDATVFCGEGSCSNSSTSYGIGAIGGTSVATPVMASVQALINQKNGGRQGNPNFFYYPLANADYTSGKQCYTSYGGSSTTPVIGGTVTLPAATCNFHDIAAGSNRSKQNAGDTTGLGFNSVAGFDEATGLGSVNITNIANNWSSVSLKATTTTFSLTPTTGAHGTSVALTAAVTATTGVPTGDISLIAITTNPSSKLRYTLAAGAYSGTVTGLPGGTYNVYLHYAGDGIYAASDSAPVSVTIIPENSVVTNALHYIQGTQIFSSVTSVPYGTDLLLNTVLTAASGSTGVPTGTITYSIALNGNTIGSATTTVDGLGDASFQSGSSAPTLLVAATWPALASGSYVITTTYSGDGSYNSNSTTNAFTVTAVAPTGTFTASSTNINSGSSVTLSYSVVRTSGTYVVPGVGQPNPSGTVTFTDTTTSAVLGTATLNSAGVASLATTGITQSGANSITATYNGDTNYSSIFATKTITVNTYTATGTTASVTTSGTLYVGASVTFSGTVSPAGTGTMYFYDGSTYLGSATVSGGVASLATTALIGGTHTITASYSGSTTYASSSGTTSVVMTPNVTSIVLDAPTFALYGGAVTLSGKISRSPTSSTVPTVPLTGTISFKEGATVIGAATPAFLPGGYAVYVGSASVSTLARGQHIITAAYSGDGNYAAATSSTVTVSVGPANNVWIANGNGSVSALTGTGAAYTGSSLTGGGTGISIDYSGNIWSLNSVSNSVVEYAPTGTVLSSGYSVGGINAPSALAIDGSGIVWIANGNGSVSAVSSTGAAVSPNAGYAVSTSTPTSINVDASGNLWLTNSGDNSVTEVIGAASPITTPLTNAVSNNTVAAKP